MSTIQKNITEISPSIIPVLTKVNPKDEEFNFDKIQDDLSEILQVNL